MLQIKFSSNIYAIFSWVFYKIYKTVNIFVDLTSSIVNSEYKFNRNNFNEAIFNRYPIQLLKHWYKKNLNQILSYSIQ